MAYYSPASSAQRPQSEKHQPFHSQELGGGGMPAFWWRERVLGGAEKRLKASVSDAYQMLSDRTTISS